MKSHHGGLEYGVPTNALYFGDNLQVLREHLADESIDLIYLDPPFNSKRDYNLLFKTPKGHQSDAQITAFEDSWHWGEQAESEFSELLHQSNTNVSEMMQALRNFLGENDMMAYLTMMANRLLELHRVLKPTGSLYLHCDPTASHYLKVLLDGIFGAVNFHNEIVWPRLTAAKAQTDGFGKTHDVVFFYARSSNFHFNKPIRAVSDERVRRHYSNVEEVSGRRYMLSDFTQAGAGPARMFGDRLISPPTNKHWIWSQERIDDAMRVGRLVFTNPDVPRVKRYLDESQGDLVEDVWSDIHPINAMSRERIGYPTQKPLALLERIIQASSNEGDVVLDPFCGCGTAVIAAQKLNRRWIGIDITHLAISLIEKRLRKDLSGVQFEVHGTPKDADGARDLAARDKYQFQWWACSLVNAQPYQGKQKGSDAGIDGLIFFQDGKTDAKKILVSVKGGEHVGAAMVRDLKGTMEREKAAIGLFVTLTPPTRPMETEAASAGFYESPHHGQFPRLQILTIEGLMLGHERPRYPDMADGGHTFKKAKVEQPAKEQGLLFAAEGE